MLAAASAIALALAALLIFAASLTSTASAASFASATNAAPASAASLANAAPASAVSRASSTNAPPASAASLASAANAAPASAASLASSTNAVPASAVSLARATSAPPARGKAKPRACANSSLLPTRTNVASIDAATLCLIDRVRAAYRLRPLHANHELQAVATTQVSDMVHWNYFADDRPPSQTPATLIEATPYGAHASSLLTGENIAWGTGVYATPANVVTAWMHSPPHREIILIPDYRDAGVSATAAVPAVVENRVPGATYAVEFGARG